MVKIKQAIIHAIFDTILKNTLVAYLHINLVHGNILCIIYNC